ncbi:AraC family transcriptional regulator [Marinitenerispora sediminis]|nr:AraC family transcriptional regulator [Marinitenerispora sediminis]
MDVTGDIVRAALDEAGGRVEHDEMGVRVHVTRSPTEPMSIVFRPVLHLPFQGRKRVVVGSREIVYGAGDLVIVGAHLPALVQVTRASAAEPYVALELSLDRPLLSALVAQMPPSPKKDVESVAVDSLPESVLEPSLRLLRLLPNPTEALILGPGVKQEIYYRLLAGPVGDALRGLLHAESALTRIEGVTEWMQNHLDTPINVGHLASHANMSVGTFHRQFRKITGTSPGNYFKTVRLHEARRQIVAQAGTLAQIASAVGFVSPAQFSRDYKRTFGVAPSRDAARFRTSTDAPAAWRPQAAHPTSAGDPEHGDRTSTPENQVTGRSAVC